MAPGWRKPVLPLDGEAPELDLWADCAHNPLCIPIAVRRQYAYHKSSDTLYREWDAADLGIHLILRACTPPPLKEAQNSAKAESFGNIGGEMNRRRTWTERVRQAVEWANNNQTTWRNKSVGGGTRGPDIQYSKPRPYMGKGDEEDVFRHLASCGFHVDRLLQPGDVYAYLKRGQELEKKLKEHKKQVKEESGLTDESLIVARARSLLEAERDGVPAAHPIVRFKVKASDAVAREHLKALRIR
ncbi:hypothetical protein AURDEDRAFT_120743 [Auricularia subglabra TFB-10046 SS5]|nr:hypothetical protein AURDEDRAFT_120743 [Auricularia subglabra TFB-10046 SS5]